MIQFFFTTGKEFHVGAGVFGFQSVFSHFVFSFAHFYADTVKSLLMCDYPSSVLSPFIGNNALSSNYRNSSTLYAITVNDCVIGKLGTKVLHNGTKLEKCRT